MSKTRYINTSFWSDPWIVDSLNPLDRYLFFYFLTNEHTTIAGVYEISLRTIANEVGLDKEELLRMLRRLEPKVRYVDGWVIIPNAIRHQNYNSPKIKTGIELVLEKVPADLMDLIKFPKDFEKPERKSSRQQSLLTPNFDEDFGQESVVDKKQGRFKVTTPAPVKYGIDTISHSKSNSKSKVNTTVKQPTTGLNKLEGRKYHDIDLLYNELSDLVNDKFKAWYCSAFFKLGREKVLNLASVAKADGKDPVKLFSHLLQKETGVEKKALRS